ncbi:MULTISPECIES: carbohydrate ABC transporter permease [Streptosporangium]|uniref:Raffinose/stachyose/melibiose transport system permease protein n=1 Tax=Streptosporangium brasiliense TaxID=47480 RepID=A0ABT9RI43_9ACTN|nr:sugar ABC transporter permease [Streptosporangium brasiliense]MDP9868010.1 raffinose/stachyose/melibiose transport system permease protein [Streptosporangium brasiliense]
MAATAVRATEPTRRQPAAPAERGSPLTRGRRRLFWPFVVPALVLYVVFYVLPALATGWISLNKWAGAGPMEFAGLDNYRRLLLDPVFQDSFANTLTILFVVGGATFALSFLLTMILRDMAGRKAVRAIIFFPNIVSGIVLSILWGFLFQAEGVVNQALRAFGVDSPPNWLGTDNLFSVIMIGLVWVQTGFFTTILMAAVDRIPKDLYEVCDLEGANAWQRFRNVTLPLMWDVVGVCAVLWSISAIKIFEFIYAFAGAAGQLPPTKVWNTALYAYAEAFASGVPKYGSAAATGMVMLALVGVLVVLLRRLFRRDPVQF